MKYYTVLAKIPCHVLTGLVQVQVLVPEVIGLGIIGSTAH